MSKYPTQVKPAVDTVGPIFQYMAPGMTAATAGHIRLTFDEAVVAGSGMITIRNDAGVIVLQESILNNPRVTIEYATVIIEPAVPLAFASSFSVEMEHGFVKDAAGNLSNARTQEFTSAPSQVALKLTGTSGADTLHGSDTDDHLSGMGGDDTLRGYRGRDVLDGGDGHDMIISGGAGSTLLGGNGNDHLSSGPFGASRLEGGAGDDRLYSSSSGDFLDGGSGNDEIHVDTSYDETGVITALGGEGNDLIDVRMGGGVSVSATGGAGIDTFAIRNGIGATGKFVIADFMAGAGGDVLSVVNMVSSGMTWQGNLFGAPGYLRLQQVGNDTVIQYDLDGASMTTHGFVTGVTLANVSMASLTAANFADGINPSASQEGLVLNGTVARDYLFGSVKADTIRGGAGDDHIEANDGRDLLEGGVGKNTLSGGAGLDVAAYAGAKAAFTVARSETGWTVRDPHPATGAAAIDDTLDGVERLRFSDSSWALDIDGAGGKVYRLYQAAFDRTPDTTGLGFWIGKVDAGVAMSQVLDFFIGSPEFAALYGAKPSNSELVSRFYQNVLHREPEAAGKAFWIATLDEGRASVADVLASFSESPENQQEVAKVIGNGFAYQEYI